MFFGGIVVPKLRTVSPTEIGIQDVVVLPRTAHHDPRGFLVETLRSDDTTVKGDTFAMSYLSLTVPGQMRDADRWHVHQHQVDRFVVLLGEMVLALYDARPRSPTEGRFTLARMAGAEPTWNATRPRKKEDATTYLVTIPPQVYHCIGNLSQEPFLLQNYPTRLYDPADEGRVPFAELPIPAAGGLPFGWERVEVVRP